jgi:hypothetical protein
MVVIIGKGYFHEALETARISMISAWLKIEDGKIPSCSLAEKKELI